MQNIELVSLPTAKDERGWVISPPVIRDFGDAFLHVPSLKPQAVRGNHYHDDHRESVIILGGKCLVATRNREINHYEEFIYDGINKQLLVINPKITHAFKNVDYHSIYLVCYYQGSKDISISTISDRILS